jgi:hypothetical protein
MSLVFLAFYSVAIYYSFKAYKEFKGVIEDNLGRDGMKKYNHSQSLSGYGALNQEDSDAAQGQ